MTGLSTPLAAQPCSGSTMQYTVFVKGDNGVNEAVTVIRDAIRDNTWYYAATRPRVAMRDGTPVFSLTTYQTRNEKDRQKTIEGGLLQFAVRLDPTETALGNLKAEVVKLAKSLKYPETIRLSPLPYKSVRVWTFVPAGGLLADGAPEQKTLTTGFATAEIPFTLSLSQIGADLYKDLCVNQTGVPVWVEYTYATLSPPAGFEVTVDWSATFKHLSRNSNTTASIGYAGCGLAFQVDRATIRETLTKNSCIKVKTTSTASVPSSAVDRYLDPILQTIYDELFETDRTRITSVNPVAAKKADAPITSLGNAVLAPLKPSSGLIQYNTSVVLKKEDKVRKDSQVIDMNLRRLEESRGGCGGFIGIGGYLAKNPSLKDKLIVEAETGNWPSATFFLPKMQGARELGITEVTLSLAIFDDKGQVAGDGVQQSVAWTAASDEDRWVSQPGNEKRSELSFPMASLYDRYGDRLDILNYRVESKITAKSRSGTRVLRNTRFVPLANGEVPLATPLSFIEVWRVNAESLEFETSGLSLITATLIDDSGRQTVQIKPDSADKRPLFLVPTCESGKETALKLAIQYTVQGANHASALNALADVRNLGPEIYLWPEWETASGSSRK